MHKFKVENLSCVGKMFSLVYYVFISFLIKSEHYQDFRTSEIFKTGFLYTI